MMRWIAAAGMLALAAPIEAKTVCGRSESFEGGAHAELWIEQENAGTPRVTLMQIDMPSGDGAYRLIATYDPSETGLGVPTQLRVRAFLDLPDPNKADPEQILWRVDSGPWFNPLYWNTPRRALGESKGRRGEVEYRLAQGPTFPERTELLNAAAGGARFDFRRLDAWDRDIGSGSVAYPPPEAVGRLYTAARAKALAKLWPCGGIATMTAPPVTMSPPLPPGPESPAMFQARACTVLRGRERQVAREQPQSGRRMKIVAQPVDCGARTVRRVYQTEGISKKDRKGLGAVLARETERMWCSDERFRSFIAQGWTFSVELRASDDTAVYAATTRKCTS